MDTIKKENTSKDIEAKSYCKRSDADISVLEGFLGDSDIDLMGLASIYVTNKNSNKEFVRKLFDLLPKYKRSPTLLLIKYASNPSADPSLLEEIFEISDLCVTDFVWVYAANPNANISLLDNLMKRPDLDTGVLIERYSNNPNADKDFLERLNGLRNF